MAKPEWGTKRACLSCGARFYDLQRSPIVCPSCGTVFDPEVASRRVRPRIAKAAAVVADTPLADDEEALAVVPDDAAEDDADVDADVVVEAEDEEETVAEVEDEDDEALIEDAGELGEEDDVADVLDDDLGEDEEPR